MMNRSPHPDVPERYLFQPEPGSNRTLFRAFWPLQLLLYCTAISSHSEKLASLLGLSATHTKQYAKAAAKFSIRFWSPWQLSDYLAQALRELEYPDPEVPVRVVKKKAIQGDNEARLGPQQERFLKLLIENAGSPVCRNQWKKANIHHPRQTKERLGRKLRAAEIDLKIIATTNGCYLIPLES